MTLAERCYSPKSSRTRPFVVDSTSGEALYAIEAGSGPRAVVLVHGSGSSGVCNWTNEFGWLPAAGFRVFGYDAACVGNSTCEAGELRPVDDLVAVIDAAHDRGARQVVVLAASAGGPLAIEIASRRDAEIHGAVALSPADLSYPAAVTAARRSRVPILYVLARDDTSATLGQIRRLHELSRHSGSRLRILSAGAGHAQETLYDGASKPSAFRADLLAFLADPTG